MSYVRGADGQVIEFTGRRTRKNYDKADKAEKEAEPAEEHRASLMVLTAGRILRPLTAYIRRRFKIKGISLTMSIAEDRYNFMSIVHTLDGDAKIATFAEAPGRRFSVWREG